MLPKWERARVDNGGTTRGQGFQVKLIASPLPAPVHNPSMSFPGAWSLDPCTPVKFTFSLTEPKGESEEQVALLVRSFSLF
ncbi:hypothetical protein KSF_085030 [Reticulibacter mediterranei]|uniref:Uncharacterized protein n=1 Tax=Reticulibacter mediterranei TaxID=2778369 RepID=A0A8J3N7G6_9CHLR|nr:hypothetical protein KSF_085030 [Reticulibacter mediterranei]